MLLLINALRKPSLAARRHVTKILQAENGWKGDKFESIISVNTNINEKWFVVFELTINHPSFGYARLPQIENCFFCFAHFFYFFFSFSSAAIYF